MPPPGISTFARLIYKSFCNILIMCYLACIL
nr:MAG TPA: CLLAC-motif containing domain protein [Caudoviricetes sp.]